MSLPWRRAIVVGASSGMGEAISRKLARDGCSVALVARRGERIARIAAEISAAGRGHALSYEHDVRHYAQVPALFQSIAHDLGGLDLIVYAAGIMPAVAVDEYSFDKDRTIVETNLLGAMAWIDEAALRFERGRGGSIVAISSVAGDRGRRGQPAYCSSKAALNAYLESIRNRVGRFGVAVTTVKPGPVATPMTEGLDKLPMIISADHAADAILQAARRRVSVVYVPGRWRPIMWIIRHIPSPLFRRLNI